MTSFTPNFIREDLLNLSAYVPTPIGNNPTELTRLDGNESPYNLPTQLREKLGLFYQNNLETNRYPDGSHWKLKTLIAEYINDSQNQDHLININNISVGNGSDELIRSILLATCLNQKGSILVANPTFSMYNILAQSLGIKVISLKRNEDNFSINLDLANQAIIKESNPPVKVIFVVHPNSPTANSLTADEIQWLKEIPSNVLVVIDEAYAEFSQKTLVKDLPNHPNWLILRTFSKAFRLAAHRVGYAIAHEKIIEILEKIRLPYNLPSFSQLAAQFALENRSLILATVEETIGEKERVYHQLKSWYNLRVWPSDSNFIYLRLVDSFDDSMYQTIIRKLKDKKIMIRHTGGGLRISIGTERENDYLLSELGKLIREI